MNKQPHFFVISVDEKQSVIKAEMAESRAEADVIANAGIGTINYIAGTIDQIDRLSVPPSDVAEEAMKFLMEVIKGRHHSTSPQCLPMAHYRKLAEFADKYHRAIETEKGE